MQKNRTPPPHIQMFIAVPFAKYEDEVHTGKGLKQNETLANFFAFFMLT